MRARSLAKFVSSMSEQIANAPQDKEWSKQEISMMLKDSMAVRSLSVNSHRDQLLTELELVEEALRPLEAKV